MNTNMNAEQSDEWASVDGCDICARVHDSNRVSVIDTAHFATAVSPQYPWGVTINAKQHKEGLWALSDDEAGDLGRLLARLSGAIHATGSERVYMASFGEEHSVHFHMILLSRWEPYSVAAHHALYDRVKKTPPQPAETDRFVAAVREHLQA
jgi:galactose-1-phosphate uridylyltransferase